MLLFHRSLCVNRCHGDRRCPCCLRMTAGARPEPSSWPRWTSAWGAVWQRSSYSEMMRSPQVNGQNTSYCPLSLLPLSPFFNCLSTCV